MPRRAQARPSVCVSALLSVLAAGEIMRAGGDYAGPASALQGGDETSRHGAAVDRAGDGAGEELSRGVWPLPCSLDPHAQASLRRLRLSRVRLWSAHRAPAPSSHTPTACLPRPAR